MLSSSRLPIAHHRLTHSNKVVVNRQLHFLVAPQAAGSGRSSTTCGASAIAAATAPLLAGLVLLSSAAPAAAGPIAILEGPARIVDGDTLYIGTEKVRLYAIDAPEKTQTCNNSRGEAYMCGQMSLQALREHVGTKPVHCEVKTRDQYGRNVAACSILSGRLSEDMGGWLVSNGYAVAYKQYGKDYVLLEEKAHATHKGIWQGGFTEPALWRKQQKSAGLTSSSSLPAPLPAALPGPAATGSSSHTAAPLTYAAVAAMGQQQAQQQTAPSPPLAAVGVGAAQCNGPLIKGNINSKGEKIYHTVASGSYARVEIDEKAGERYFCTEQEAQASGWRAALR